MKKLLILLFLFVPLLESMENVGNELLASAKIVALSTGAATLYGIANAELSAYLCPEFFSQGGMLQMQNRLPRNNILKWMLVSTDSPALKAAIWAPITSWWVGAAAGVPLAILARLGTQMPQLSAGDLIKPLAIAMVATATVSASFGAFAAYKARNPEYLASFKINNINLMNGIPEKSELGYVAAACNTAAGYRLAVLAKLGLCGFVITKRLYS